MSNSIRQPRLRTVKHRHTVSRKHSRVIFFTQLTAVFNGISLIGLAMVLSDNFSITPRIALLLIAGGMFTLAIGLHLYMRDADEITKS